MLVLVWGLLVCVVLRVVWSLLFWLHGVSAVRHLVDSASFVTPPAPQVFLFLSALLVLA